MVSTAVTSPSNPPTSSSVMASMSLVSRDVTRPEVKRSWKATSSRWKWVKTRRRSSSSTSWPMRPDTRRNAIRPSDCSTTATSIAATIIEQRAGAPAGHDRRQAAVDAAGHEQRDGQPGGVLDEDDQRP